MSGRAAPNLFSLLCFDVDGLRYLCIGPLMVFGFQVGSQRMLLVRSMIGLLVSEKSLGPLETPNGKRSKIYAIFFIMVISITAILTNTCNRLYTTSMSILDMNMCELGWCMRMMCMVWRMHSKQCP